MLANTPLETKPFSRPSYRTLRFSAMQGISSSISGVMMSCGIDRAGGASARHEAPRNRRAWVPRASGERTGSCNVVEQN